MILIESGNTQSKILINQINSISGSVFVYKVSPITSTCNTLSLTNGGATSVNGTYIIAGTYNGYNLYTKDGNSNSYPKIRFNQENNYWEIVGTNPFIDATLYYTTNIGPCPASLDWEIAFGFPEPPTFSIIN